MSFLGLIFLASIMLIVILGWDTFAGIIQTLVDYTFEIIEVGISKAKETSP